MNVDDHTGSPLPITCEAAEGDGGAAVQLQFLTASEWESFAAGFDDVFHEQTATFNRARWSAERCEFVSVSHGGKPIGGAAVIVIRAPLVKTGLAILKWGPLWRRSEEPANPAHFAMTLNAIRAEYTENRDFHLTIMPRGDAHASPDMISTLARQGFAKGDALPAPTRYLVNVSQSESALRASLSQKWRYNLKKAEKNGFVINVVRDSSGLDTFMGLYTQMLRRKGFSDHSAIQTLPSFFQTGISAFRPEFVFAYHSNELCAAAVIDRSGDCAGYLYGATSDDSLQLRAGYALHWAVARSLCEDPKVNWYDLGGNDLDKGLHQFKTGFVGKTGLEVECPEAYHRSNNWRATMLGTAVFAARRYKQSLDQLRINFPSGLRRRA